VETSVKKKNTKHGCLQHSLRDSLSPIEVSKVASLPQNSRGGGMEGIGKGGQWMPRISAKLSVEERSNWSEGHQHRSWRDRVVQTDRTNKDMVVVGSFKEEKEKEREREP